MPSPTTNAILAPSDYYYDDEQSDVIVGKPIPLVTQSPGVQNVQVINLSTNLGNYKYDVLYFGVSHSHYKSEQIISS